MSPYLAKKSKLRSTMETLLPTTCLAAIVSGKCTSWREVFLFVVLPKHSSPWAPATHTSEQTTATHTARFRPPALACAAKAGDRHFGKVEVYRRIGGCGVDFDPMKPGDRQVSMDCGAAGDLRLGFRLCVCRREARSALAPRFAASFSAAK